MTSKLEPLTGRTLPARPAADPRDELLARLTASWLGTFASRHTRIAYRRDLGYWLAWCDAIRTHPLDVRPADVNDWLTCQRERGARGDGTPAAPRSIARRLSVAASWYAYLIQNTAADPEPLIGHNPAANAARPKVDRDESPTVGLTREDADRIIAEADRDGPRTSAIIRLMLTNAVRCDTICTLEIPELIWDRGHRTITKRVKGGKLVKMPLPPATSLAVDTYLESRGQPADGLVFVTSTGRGMDEPALFRLVRRMAGRAKVRDAGRISPHGLRHTAITEALDATHGDVRKAQKLAGHADPRTTMLYDLRRTDLDGHAAYVLATRYGASNDDA